MTRGLNTINMPNVIADQFKQLVKDTISSRLHQNRRKNRKSRRRSKNRRRKNRSSSSSRDSNRRDRIHRRRSKQSRNPTYSELKNNFRFLRVYQPKWCRYGCFSILRVS